MKNLLFVALLTTTAAQAGGLGNVMINAGEINQGISEQQRRERQAQQGQQPQQERRLASVVCGPAYGTPELQQKQCTRTYVDGRQEQVTCQKDVSGSVNCF